MFSGDLVQVRRKIDLVYGGGGNGLMGKVAQTVHDGGGHVIGYTQSPHYFTPYTVVKRHLKIRLLALTREK